MSLPEELTRIAQNDYMVDGEFLHDGVLLNQAAQEINDLKAELEKARMTHYMDDIEY